MNITNLKKISLIVVAYENEQLKATFYEEESALNYKVALEQKIL